MIGGCIGLATIQLSAPAFAQTGNGYDLTWSVIQAGTKVISSGSGYQLYGTIGQAGTASLSGNGYALQSGSWSAASGNGGCSCVVDADCMESDCTSDNACNCVTCSAGQCVFFCTTFGNINCDGGYMVNLDDILCGLGGFADFSQCPNADVAPCGGNSVISLDDILGVLNAFASGSSCGCASSETVPLCGSTSP